MSSATATFNDFSASKQLVPAEIAARINRQADNSSRQGSVSGSTVDQEGLTNNYAVSPKMSYAAQKTDAQNFRLGVIFAIATWAPIAIAALVS